MYKNNDLKSFIHKSPAHTIYCLAGAVAIGGITLSEIIIQAANLEVIKQNNIHVRVVMIIVQVLIIRGCYLQLKEKKGKRDRRFPLAKPFLILLIVFFTLSIADAISSLCAILF